MFSPALLVGPMEEKQTLKVEMFSEFLEMPVNLAKTLPSYCLRFLLFLLKQLIFLIFARKTQ